MNISQKQNDDILAALGKKYVSLKKQCEKDLQYLIAEVEKYRIIADFTANWEACFDNKGKLTWMNPFSQTVTGYTPDEYYAVDDFVSFITIPEKLKSAREIFNKVLHGNEIKDFELPIKRKDGSIFWSSISCRTIYSYEGSINGFRASFHDISGRKNEKETLVESEERLKELNESKNKFLSIISHDLRSPISSIIEFTEIMANNSFDFSIEELRKMSKQLNLLANQSFSLLSALLEWTRMESGLITYKPLKLWLQPIVTEALHGIKRLADAKSIEIKLNIKEDETLFADNNMIQIVFRNLLTNAIKFTRKGGKIIVTSHSAKDYIMCSVQDNGIGMSDEIARNLFRIDTRTKRSGTDGEQSSGLGLLLCKEFIEKHGGKIWAVSEENKGSTFHFTIPKNSTSI